MPEEKPKITFCPNCNQQATKQGNEVICEACDAIFVITKKDGAKVKQLGPLDDLTKRIEKLEGLHKDEPGTEPGQEPETDNDDEEILPR